MFGSTNCDGAADHCGVAFLPRAAAYGQTGDAAPAAETVEVNAKGGGWSVTLRLPKTVRAGEPVPLTYLLKNEGDGPGTFYCPIYRNCLPEVSSATLSDVKPQQPCRFTPVGRHILGDGVRAGSGVFLALKVNEEQKFSSDLADVFELTPGEYELSLVTQLRTVDGKGSAKIELPPMRFRYLPKSDD